MANTFTLINKSTVTSAGTSGVTFSSIPSTYTDLWLIASIRTNRSGAINDFVKVAFNSDTTDGNYVGRFFYGDGTNVGAYTQSAASAPRHIGDVSAANATSSTFSVTRLRVPDYTSTSRYKVYSADSASENNATGAIFTMDAGKWLSNSAINSISLTPGVGSNFVENSSFYLYGISKQ